MLKKLSVFAIAMAIGLDTSYGLAQEAKPNETTKATAGDDFPGTVDFEEASRIRMKANTRASLGEVVKLLQSSLSKGLDEVDTVTAKQLLATTSFLKAKAAFEEAAGARLNNNALARLAKEALEDLQVAIDADKSFADSFILKARIHVLRQEVRKATETLDQATEAIKATMDRDGNDAENKSKLSDVYFMKSVLRQDVDDRIRDLRLAIETDAANERAIQQAVETLSALGRLSEAKEIVQKNLDANPDSELAIQRMANLYLQNQEIDEALKFLTSKIEKAPENSNLLAARALVLLANQKFDESIADATKAIELKPDNLDAKLTRAKANLLSKKYDAVHEDLDALEQARPDLVEIRALRMDLAVQEKRFGDAIADLERLVQANPDNRGLLLQLASYYHADNRPKKALRIVERLIKADNTDWQSYRLRGDIFLAQGKHQDAINDYELALENIPDDDDDYSGVLNNLSWVLSTSPDDSVRNGNRALELGLKACELTKYEKPHILSTLAAAYGELGQFDKAVEWSEKAVELGKKQQHEQTDQLELELQSYKSKMPWREKQQTEDKPAKAAPADNGVDT